MTRYQATFTHNHLSKVYWVLIIIGLIFAFTNVDDWIVKVIIGLPALFIIFWAIKTMSHKVEIVRNKIISKDLFSEKTAIITPRSRIYVKQSLQTFNIIFRHYDYVIRIENDQEVIKINANVNDADELFAIVRSLEAEIIYPALVQKFESSGQLQIDSHFLLSQYGIQYKNKSFDYIDLSSITFDNGYLRLNKAGKLWETCVLSVPAFNIPNLITFMSIVKATS